MVKKTFKELTTIRTGGEISYFKPVKNKTELKKAVSYAKEKNLPIFILGGGSDILASDRNFNGVAIKCLNNKIYIKGNVIKAEAGVIWDNLVCEAISDNLQGIEKLSGIPGTVGAAPVQNIGAYGQELSDVFVSLTAYDIKNEKFVTFKKKDCKFGYRESVFKKKSHWQKYIIWEVTIKLKINNKLGLFIIRNHILNTRDKKIDDWKKVPNAGSFFKNPIVDEIKLKYLLKKYPNMPFFKHGNKFKLSAGWFVEKAGWKGKSMGEAMVSGKHALIITNPKGKAFAKEIKYLADKVAIDVYKKFNIKLTPEVQLINFVCIEKKKNVAILGYGIEGKDVKKFIKSRGLKVDILDRKYDKYYLKDLDKYDTIIRSPGVYRYSPELVKAEKAGVEITSAIKIFFDLCPGKIIGVTGTKGKGTTSTLIYEILKNAGYNVYLAGNIGKPYLELLPRLTKKSWVVMEMSSFQLIDMQKSPVISVVLNITSDHLDWHKSQKEYVEAKKNIVKYQLKNDWAVLNKDYKKSESFEKYTKARVIFFSKNKLENEYRKDLLLRGVHNLENIAAAVAVGKILKIKSEIMLDTVRSFKGLEHRLELVRRVNGVTFYNDSFATGPQPTIAAIKSFTEPITIILGGSKKGLNYKELGKAIKMTKNIKNIILIGTTASKIVKSLGNKETDIKIYNLGFTPMKEIVAKAYHVSKKGSVVILSPASASFDMFENYKDRGNQFKKAVLALK
ncbi:UDP-N-acetylmuramoyl-L-alanine--D-glutamate ligase [Patescibacteria group bacterium]